MLYKWWLLVRNTKFIVDNNTASIFTDFGSSERNKGSNDMLDFYMD